MEYKSCKTIYYNLGTGKKKGEGIIQETYISHLAIVAGRAANGVGTVAPLTYWTLRILLGVKLGLGARLHGC